MLVAEVSARTAEETLGAELHLEQGADGAVVAVPTEPLAVPAALRGTVREVVGLAGTVRPGTATPTASPSDTTGCAEARRGAADGSGIAEHYGVTALRRQGIDGAGTHLMLLATQQLDPRSVTVFSRCYGYPHARVRTTTVAGAPEVGTGLEVTMDAIVASTIAPGAEVEVLRFDDYQPMTFALAQALVRDPDVLSTSVTTCEDDMSAAEASVDEWLLTVLAARGTTTLASAGDHGVAGCYPASEKPVALFPASSPSVVAVGGTTATFDAGRISDEAVWHEPPYAGGGGTSDLYPGRALPDVSFLADPAEFGTEPVCDDGGCSWQDVGGTSASAPGAAAVVALLDSGLDERLGSLRPLLPTLGRGVVHDVVTGSNALFGNDCCQARRGYDRASGWGWIDALALYEHLSGASLDHRGPALSRAARSSGGRP